MRVNFEKDPEPRDEKYPLTSDDITTWTWAGVVVEESDGDLYLLVDNFNEGPSVVFVPVTRMDDINGEERLIVAHHPSPERRFRIYRGTWTLTITNRDERD